VSGHDWIATDRQVEDLIDELLTQPRYALDTEFHRERTYFPRLALVQLAWPGGLALVDPTTVDATRLCRLFDGAGLAVLHAAQQDLDVLTHACGGVPRHLFDTQLAAGFLGQSTPSLASLVQAELRIVLPKGDRLTDWLRRPLSAEQQEYAAADVAHLLDLHDRLTASLTGLGRLEWAQEANEELRTRPTGVMDPDDAWLRLKDVRSLKARSRGIARSVAAWRERRAMAADVPPRQILADLAVLGIAQKAPRTAKDLSHARGVDERHVRGGFANEILKAVAEGIEHPVDAPRADDDALDRSLRPAVTLVSAWVSQLAREQRIDNALLATRADLVALLRGDADARLRHGWRAEVVGADIERLVGGRAALAFDPSGGLRLLDLP
jgi:ribonuclease D